MRPPARTVTSPPGLEAAPVALERIFPLLASERSPSTRTSIAPPGPLVGSGSLGSGGGGGRDETWPPSATSIWPATISMRPPTPVSRLELWSEPRSEEHTSELQSLRHLVCRLLL